MLQLCFLFCVDGQHIICAGMTRLKFQNLFEIPKIQKTKFPPAWE